MVFVRIQLELQTAKIVWSKLASACERKYASFAIARVDPECTAHQLDKLLRNGKSQACTTEFPGG